MAQNVNIASDDSTTSHSTQRSKAKDEDRMRGVADAVNPTIEFSIAVDGRIVRCMAPAEFLRAKYGAGADPTSWRTAYAAKLPEIARIVA
jgi:hypothetical protein